LTPGADVEGGRHVAAPAFSTESSSFHGIQHSYHWQFPPGPSSDLPGRVPGPPLATRWIADGFRATLRTMGSVVWGREIAEVYDATYAAKFEASVLEPMIDVLVELARGGPALEFAVGTGGVALPLSARGISVSGIELSPHMVEQLRAKPGADAIPVTVGDMTTTRVPGTFTLVYLVANTIMNVTTQDDQVAVFANAAAHLEPGGCFVVEVIVPQLRLFPPGET